MSQDSKRLENVQSWSENVEFEKFTSDKFEYEKLVQAVSTGISCY